MEKPMAGSFLTPGDKCSKVQIRENNLKVKRRGCHFDNPFLYILQKPRMFYSDAAKDR